MFLNVNLSLPPIGGTSTLQPQQESCTANAPRTPEILNSLISLTSPALPPTYAHYQGSSAELLSPDCSTPGDECGGGGGWGAAGDGSTHAPNSNNNSTRKSSSNNNSNNNSRHQFYTNPTGHHPHHQYPSSSLLTPTSDGSPPPPPGGNCMFPPYTPGGGPHAPELPSPISTVEATRSALIKEGLKLTITSKLHQTVEGGVAGGEPKNEDLLIAPDGVVIKMELTPEDQERRRRRRERNKVAATKCRNKKKEMAEILVSESETVEEMNIRLKGEVERLTSEKDLLEKYLTDTRHQSNCRHPRPPTFDKNNAHITQTASTNVTNHNNKVPELALTSPSSSPSHHLLFLPNASPSSYSSCSASPCSFTSLLSPTDNSNILHRSCQFNDIEASYKNYNCNFNCNFNCNCNCNYNCNCNKATSSTTGC